MGSESLFTKETGELLTVEEYEGFATVGGVAGYLASEQAVGQSVEFIFG